MYKLPYASYPAFMVKVKPQTRVLDMGEPGENHFSFYCSPIQWHYLDRIEMGCEHPNLVLASLKKRRITAGCTSMRYAVELRAERVLLAKVAPSIHTTRVRVIV